MKTHTPGPWSYYEHSTSLLFVVGNIGKSFSGETQAAVAHVCPTGRRALDEANAQLIAQSPALLAALQAIDAAYDSSATHGHSIASPLYSAIMDARRLLAVNGWTNPRSRSEVLSDSDRPHFPEDALGLGERHDA